MCERIKYQTESRHTAVDPQQYRAEKQTADTAEQEYIPQQPQNSTDGKHGHHARFVHPFPAADHCHGCYTVAEIQHRYQQTDLDFRIPRIPALIRQNGTQPHHQCEGRNDQRPARRSHIRTAAEIICSSNFRRIRHDRLNGSVPTRGKPFCDHRNKKYRHHQHRIHNVGDPPRLFSGNRREHGKKKRPHRHPQTP